MGTASRRLPHTWPGQIEWPTLGLLVLCFATLGAAVFLLPYWSLWLAFPVLVLALTLHASLTHEVLHGHPFPSRILSEALVHINPGLAIPYLRFRDMHLAHHQDSQLTDPYDYPESNFLDPAVWASLPWVIKTVLSINNTLAGRMVVGPVVAQVLFMKSDWASIRAGDRQVLIGWVLHIPGVALVSAVIASAPIPVWLYLVAVYTALSILKIRTFLEHQAHELSRGRTVIIEDRGILAFLFLNNNLHVVHHMHPKVPWYRLPALYGSNKDRYLRRNDGYVYRNYRQIFAHYFLRAKDPVPHPLWPAAK